MESKLVKKQSRKIEISNINTDYGKIDLVITIKYDDECGNGHNTFSITGSIYKTGHRSDINIICLGCIHNEIKKYAPEYKKYIKWHLMSSDGPMHYIANTLYHASKIEKYDYFVYLIDEEFKIKELLGIFSSEEAEKIKKKYKNIIIEKKPDSLNKEPNLDAARESAIAPEATMGQLQSKEWLMARLPSLIVSFKKDMEELGFVY